MPGGPGVSKRAPKFELGCCPALRHGHCAPAWKISPPGGSRRNWYSNWLSWTRNTKIWKALCRGQCCQKRFGPQCGLLEEENARLEESLLGDSGLSFQGPVVTIDLLVSLFEILDHRQFQRAVLVVVITSHTIVMNHGDKSWSNPFQHFSGPKMCQKPSKTQLFPGPRSFATRRIFWSPTPSRRWPRLRSWRNGCGTLRGSSRSWKQRQQRIGAGWGWNWPMQRLGMLLFPARWGSLDFNKGAAPPSSSSAPGALAGARLDPNMCQAKCQNRCRPE